MNQIEAAVAEYNKTILELQTRLANAAAQVCELMEQLEAKSKEIEELKKKAEPPDLKVVEKFVT